MLENAADVGWHDPTHAVPAGSTIIAMSLTYSIAYDLTAGIVSYPVVIQHGTACQWLSRRETGEFGQ
jgi:xanthine/uracil/vitamin C permease (AzgA family)